MILPGQKHLFDIPPEVTFLNCSNMAPLLNTVRTAGLEALNRCGRPWEFTAGDWFGPGEELRHLFARVIGSDKERVALVPSVSYGMAVAARNIRLPPSRKIVVLQQQYPSNYYAWGALSKASGAEIVTVARPEDNKWTQAVLNTIDRHTGLVAIPNCHWTDGTLIDLEEVGRAARSVNASLVIDGSQSVGAYPLDVGRIKPDFLVTVGYKWLLGPYGLAYLYADQKYCVSGEPIEHSWLIRKGAEDFAALVDYQDDYRPGARRFDSGEYPSFIKIPMAIAALRQVLEWGVGNIQATLSLLTDEIETRARQAGLTTTGPGTKVGHMLGIRFPGERIASLQTRLTAEKVYISWRGTNMRISPHLFNDAGDLDRLFSVLGGPGRT